MRTMFIILMYIGVWATIENVHGSSVTCSDQHGEMYTCMMNLKQTPEVKLIMDKEKNAKETCLTDYPKTCTAEMNLVETCMAQLANDLQSGKDPEIGGIINKTNTAMETCFQQYPSNPLADLEILFSGPVIPVDLKRRKRGASRMCSGSDEKKKRSSEGKSNSSESSEEDNGKLSISNLPLNQECAQSPEQVACIRNEMAKANTDGEFSNAVNVIVQKKQECENKVSRSCKLSTPELANCYWNAHKDLFELFFGKLDACVKENRENNDSAKEHMDEVVITFDAVNSAESANESSSENQDEHGSHSNMYFLMNESGNETEDTEDHSSHGQMFFLETDAKNDTEEHEGHGNHDSKFFLDTPVKNESESSEEHKLHNDMRFLSENDENATETSDGQRKMNFLTDWLANLTETIEDHAIHNDMRLLKGTSENGTEEQAEQGSNGNMHFLSGNDGNETETHEESHFLTDSAKNETEISMLLVEELEEHPMNHTEEVTGGPRMEQ